MNEDDRFLLAGRSIRLGTSEDVRLPISQTYVGDSINIPLRVIRGAEPGPKLFVTAAIHGDEINGTGIIHDFFFNEHVVLQRGTLILAPVVNVFGFETHERYLPDRRDLNRSFPGSPNGSLASRIAHTLMQELVHQCDFGIDLHTAAVQRTNFPNIRADLTNPRARRLASAFGCMLTVDGKGPLGSFRREATRSGCPTIILEAGEPWKVEPAVLQIGIRGIRNVLAELGMVDEAPEKPPFQVKIRKSSWVRAAVGGILKFHVSPGDFVEAGQAVATNYSIMGVEQSVLTSDGHGIVLGMTTMPAVKPGEPICHIAALSDGQVHRFRKKLEATRTDLHAQAQIALATNLDVVPG